MYRKIYNLIKKYNTIVIVRHIGPDPDALGAQLGFREIIRYNFPEKNVYAIGAPAAKFKYLGNLDKNIEYVEKDTLLIVVDTPDKKRIDVPKLEGFGKIIKIDHHPLMDDYADLAWIDDTATSVCQMIIELCAKTKLKITNEGAQRLFVGLMADTNRFLFIRDIKVLIKNLDLVKYLLSNTNIDVTPLYESLYMRNINELKLQGFISQNMEITRNGVGYINITDDKLKEYDVDAASAGNMVNSFNYIEGILVWLTISEDVKNKNIRVNIRSRGPVINKVAEEYNGGGHKMASGVRLSNYDQVYELIDKLDNACQEYKSNMKGSAMGEDK